MKTAEAIIRSRMKLVEGLRLTDRKTCEGGCGVIGIIGTERLEGRLIIRSCEQMQNRGNGKGGGVAAVGLFDQYPRHYALHLAYLDESARGAVEQEFLIPGLEIAHAERQAQIDDYREAGLTVRPPEVWRYFVRVRRDRLDEFAAAQGIADETAAEDEYIYQNSFRLNSKYYVQQQPPQAFVLSHGRDLMILKAVGYAEQVARYYRLEEQKANLWIGHQRYPTRGRVWHPGGAHPFAGLHEALVHNGDFANYYAVTEYLRQRGIVPLFITDTEVSVLLFDLYTRVLGYPLEYVIEALAPTPEGDFERLSKRRQRIYRAIQSAHLHGSPDGPWFFIVARADPQTGAPQLIGITDVSMLRPQVFALQEGEKSFGAIASEKQAIDAFFEEVAANDPKVIPVADRYWNARGGSYTDGGAFIYTLIRGEGRPTLDVRDKFGNLISAIGSGGGKTDQDKPITLRRAFDVTPERLRTGQKSAGPAIEAPSHSISESAAGLPFDPEDDSAGREENRVWGELIGRPKEQRAAAELRSDLVDGQGHVFVSGVQKFTEEIGWKAVLAALTFLRNRDWDPGELRRSEALSLVDQAIARVLDTLPGWGQVETASVLRLNFADAWQKAWPAPDHHDAVLAIDARGFPPEGPQAVSRVLVEGHRKGWRSFIVYRCQGDRFLGCGLGPRTEDVRLDIYGSSGDYLGSGLDGAQIYVHGNAQDQVGQILKSGRIVVYGSVGQTFLYGAKGGETYIKGSAAGRPLINAVGRIRSIINGTCLDYCAESFMAGEQLDGGFVIINGLNFTGRGEIIGLEMKYPGNNLFSLASGGACYLNDPYRTVNAGQLNGASFVPFKQDDWNVILPYLRFNEQLFGLSIRHDLLMVDGVLKWPKEVFRKVVASVETGKLDWSSLPV